MHDTHNAIMSRQVFVELEHILDAVHCLERVMNYFESSRNRNTELVT